MSGTETLVPYIKEHEREQPVIIVDTREASATPKIVKGLREQGAEVTTKLLPKGDYVLSNVCAVERKTVHDFVYTLMRRHLFDQLFKLKEVYSNPIILIEGYMPIIYKFSRIKPSSVWGAMFALAKQGIALIHTTSYKETVDFLYTAAKQEQIVEKRIPAIHPVKKTETLADAQLFFMASLPNIGRERAISLLNAYQTPMNALLNTERWAENVHGLGPKIAEKTKQVLHKPYRE
ncbi:MAG: ERCC4 domain-containing protein [Candidatus Bathyarchaeota archaeon]|jgi:ERCC4-type nuclease